MLNPVLRTSLIMATAILLTTGCDSSTTETVTIPTIEDTSLLGLSSYTQVDINKTQRADLAYLWNEEKLAYDLYRELGAVWPDNGAGTTNPMPMIANMSEVVHMQYVEDLVAWYDINVSDEPNFRAGYSAEELDAMLPGTFTIDAIFPLYDDLNTSGQPGFIDTLQVGCIVEVTDVDDLNVYIEQSLDNPALYDTFTLLRAESYKHYWKFHNTLFGLDGIGCAFSRDGVDYNKTDVYPQ